MESESSLGGTRSDVAIHPVGMMRDLEFMDAGTAIKTEAVDLAIQLRDSAMELGIDETDDSLTTCSTSILGGSTTVMAETDETAKLRKELEEYNDYMANQEAHKMKTRSNLLSKNRRSLSSSLQLPLQDMWTQLR